jgi:hypothetical protein
MRGVRTVEPEEAVLAIPRSASEWGEDFFVVTASSGCWLNALQHRCRFFASEKLLDFEKFSGLVSFSRLQM